MSKLAQAIEQHQTQVRRIPDSALTDVLTLRTDAQPILATFPYHYEYRMEARFGLVVALPSDDTARSVEERNYALRRTRRQVVEAVFGEFRAPMYEIERLIYARRYDDAQAVLRELHDQMFQC